MKSWCSCGCTEVHTVLARRTFDGVLVELDSAGAVWFGHHRSPELGFAPARTEQGAARVKSASRAVFYWVEVFDADEVQELLTVARSMPRAPATVAEVRAEMARRADPAPPRTITRYVPGLDAAEHGLYAAESWTVNGKLRSRMDGYTERVPNPAYAAWARRQGA